MSAVLDEARATTRQVARTFALACRLLPRDVLEMLAWLLSRLAYRVEVRGRENLAAAKERAVIVPNHASFLDGALVAAAMLSHRSVTGRSPPDKAIALTAEALRTELECHGFQVLEQSGQFGGELGECVLAPFDEVELASDRVAHDGRGVPQDQRSVTERVVHVPIAVSVPDIRSTAALEVERMWLSARPDRRRDAAGDHSLRRGEQIGRPRIGGSSGGGVELRHGCPQF